MYVGQILCVEGMPIREDFYDSLLTCKVGGSFASPASSPQCWHQVAICCLVDSG